jgi:prepilin-type N-terminal cleavage/methylation domain-containing protein
MAMSHHSPSHQKSHSYKGQSFLKKEEFFFGQSALKTLFSEKCDRGWTLIEIVIVLFVISLVFAIVSPHLKLQKTPGLREVSLKIAGEYRALYWEAISKQQVLRLKYDLDKGTVSAFRMAPDGSLKPVSIRGISVWSIAPKVRFTRIHTLHQGRVESGRTFTQFFPTGAVEPTTIHLSDRHSHSMTITVNPVNGRTHIFKGDVEAPSLPPLLPGGVGNGAFMGAG